MVLAFIAANVKNMTGDPERSGSVRFEVSIDRDGEVPMGVQLGWALWASIQEGNFKPGHRLPPLREMAETTGLNINTVRVVYQRLEQKGLIQSQQGSGIFFCNRFTGDSIHIFCALEHFIDINALKSSREKTHCGEFACATSDPVP